MNEVAEIRERIMRIAAAGRNAGAVVLTVEVIEVYDKVCTVKLGDFRITNVRLYSQATQEGNIKLTPKVGSMATVLTDVDLRDMELIKCDSISSFLFSEQGLTVELDAETGKVDIKNNQVSLKDLFQSLANVVKNLKVSVLAPNSISGPVDPGTLTAVAQFETSFKQLLK